MKGCVHCTIIVVDKTLCSNYYLDGQLFQTHNFEVSSEKTFPYMITYISPMIKIVNNQPKSRALKVPFH